MQSFEDLPSAFTALILQQLVNDTEIANMANERLLSLLPYPDSAAALLFLLADSDSDFRVKGASLVLLRRSIFACWPGMDSTSRSALVNALFESFARMTDIADLERLWSIIISLYAEDNNWEALQEGFGQIRSMPGLVVQSLLVSVSICKCAFTYKDASDFNWNSVPLSVFNDVIAEASSWLPACPDPDSNLTICCKILKLIRLMSIIFSIPLDIAEVEPYFAIRPAIDITVNSGILLRYWREVIRVWIRLIRPVAVPPIPLLQTVKRAIFALAEDQNRSIEDRSIPLRAICQCWPDLRLTCAAGATFLTFLLRIEQRLFSADMRSKGWCPLGSPFQILRRIAQLFSAAASFRCLWRSIDDILQLHLASYLAASTLIYFLGQAITIIPEGILPHMDEVLPIVQYHANSPGDRSVVFAVLDFVSGLVADEFAGFIPPFLGFLWICMDEDDEIKGAACVTLANISCSLSCADRQVILANSEAFLAVSPADFFFIVAAHVDSDAVIPLQVQAELLQLLLGFLDREPGIFSEALGAITVIIKRSEVFLPQILPALGQAFEAILAERRSDYLGAMVTFMSELCATFGSDRPDAFIQAFAAPALQMIVATDIGTLPDELAPLLAAIEDPEPLLQMISGDPEVLGTPEACFIFAGLIDRIDTGILLAMLRSAFVHLGQFERDTNMCEQFSSLIRNVFCASMSKRREPELIQFYYTLGTWLVNVLRKNVLAVDAIYEYIGSLVSCESEDRDAIVQWILQRVQFENSPFPYHDANALADLLALDLMPPDYDIPTAHRAFALIGQAPNSKCFGYCVRALAELAKKEVPEVIEFIVAHIDVFAERISHAEKTTQAIIGRMLLQIHGGEVDINLPLAALSVFPVDDASPEVGEFAEAVLAAKTDERLAEPAMLAIARYFAACPHVRNVMGFGAEIVVRMRNELLALMAFTTMTADELAHRIGVDEMIPIRLASVLGE
jgi:hypothetical protein